MSQGGNNNNNNAGGYNHNLYRSNSNQQQVPPQRTTSNNQTQPQTMPQFIPPQRIMNYPVGGGRGGGVGGVGPPMHFIPQQQLQQLPPQPIFIRPGIGPPPFSPPAIPQQQPQPSSAISPQSPAPGGVMYYHHPSMIPPPQRNYNPQQHYIPQQQQQQQQQHQQIYNQQQRPFYPPQAVPQQFHPVPPPRTASPPIPNSNSNNINNASNSAATQKMLADMKLENEKLSIQLTTALSQHKESSALLASQSSTMDHLQKDLDAAVQEISRLNLVSEHFKDLATTTSSSSSSNTSNNNSSGANLYSEKQQKEMEEEINALTSELGLLRRDNEGLLEKLHQTATLELNLNDTLVQLELLDAKTKTLTDKLDVAEASKNDAEAKLCVFADKIVRLEADRAADAQRLQFAERQAADQSGTSRQLITSIESRLQEAETSRAMFEEEAAKACVELAACKAENARLTKLAEDFEGHSKEAEKVYNQLTDIIEKDRLAAHATSLHLTQTQERLTSMEQQYAAQIKFLTHHLDKASADVANMQYYMEKNTAPGSFDAYLKDEVDELRVKYQNFIKAEQSWISDRRIVEETHKAEIETHLKMIEQLNGEYASLQLQYEELLTKNIDLQTRLAAIK